MRGATKGWMLAKGRLTRGRFAAMLRRIAMLGSVQFYSRFRSSMELRKVAELRLFASGPRQGAGRKLVAPYRAADVVVYPYVQSPPAVRWQLDCKWESRFWPAIYPCFASC
jgi:hypothetical protein